MPFAFRRALVMGLALAPASLLSQTFRGALNGTVTDATGAVLSGATVQLLDPATDTKLTAHVNNAGEYNFTEIPVGSTRFW